MTVFLPLATLLSLVYVAQLATDRPASGHPLRSATKTGATLGLAALGLATAAPGLIVLGLALGAAGDFFLSRPGQKMFLAGMAAFAAGHLAYVAAFWARGAALGQAPLSGHTPALIALGLVVLALGLWLSSKAGPLRLPVLGYALVIGLMAAAALILPLSPGRDLIQAGAALFLLSDTLLALRLFASPPAAHKPLDLAVWPAYWLGQALILWGSHSYWAYPPG